MIRRWNRERPGSRRRRRWTAEQLESRRLLAGNLTMVDVQFVDSDRAPIGEPTVGEQVFLRAEWRTTNLLPTDRYRVRFEDTTAGVTDITLDSALFSGVPGVDLTFVTYMGGWYATPGQHHIRVTVDGAAQIAETTELDNRFVLNYEPNPANLPEKWIQPLSGEQNVDWAVVNYADVWPVAGEFRDYLCDNLSTTQLCQPYSFDGSRGMEFELPNFAAKDRGQPVYAVADGLVVPGVAGEIINGIKAGDQAATISRNLGDLNGDGLPDYLFTAPTAAVDTALQVGELYVLYGRPGGFPETVELSDLLTVNGGDGSLGFVVRGVAATDLTAVSVSTGGDFNGDGVNDFAIGAPNADPNGANSGRTYVLFGQPGGYPAEIELDELLAVNGGDGSRGVVFEGAAAGDNSGRSVALIGDLNGDGFGELAIGAPNANGPNFLFRDGHTYVVFGGVGPWPAQSQLSNLRTANGGDGSTGFLLYGSANFEFSGTSVGSAGDLNGDAVQDLAIGAPGFGGGTVGEIYVVYGKTAGQQATDPFPAEFSLGDLLTVNLGDGTLGFVLQGVTGAGVGREFRSTSDLNGDGRNDFLIGATTGGTAGAAEGQVLVVYGATANFPAEYLLQSLLPAFGGDGTAGAVITGDLAGDLVGTSFDVVGDIDGDGLTDLLIGAPGGNKAHLLYGAAGGWDATVDLSDLGFFDGPAGVTFLGINAGDRAGQSVSGAGDLNGDGRLDLLVGASLADPNGTSSGQAYVIYGQPTPFRRTVDLELLTEDRQGLVQIDHGGGWLTRYDNLDPRSVTLRPGDVVEQGDVLGVVGQRAGGDLRLYFEVEHNLALVETYLDPTSYWVAPLEYQAHSDQQVLDIGVTNVDPTADLLEHPSDVRYLHPTYTGPLHVWFDVSHLNPNDEYQVIWHLPNGATLGDTYHCIRPKFSPLYGSFCDVRDFGPIRMGRLSESLQLEWNRFAGDWYATVEINGQERARTYFSIVSSPIEPEMRVTYGDAVVGNPILIDGRSTPIGLGSAALGDAGPTETFTIENHGSVALHLSDLRVPAGFRLVGGFPAQINPRENASFVLELDTSFVGFRSGTVSFQSDDADEGSFEFVVQGRVSGGAVVGAPSLELPGPAAAYQWGDPPVPIDLTARVIDLDSPAFGGGRLEVSLFGAVADTDRLTVRNEGSGVGQVSVAGDSVSIDGNLIATLSGGQGSTPLRIEFQSAATLATVEAVTRQVAYSSVADDPGTSLKYVQFLLTDDTALNGPPVYSTIVLAPSVLNSLPLLASLDVAPTAVVQPATIALTAGGVVDLDGFVAAVEFYVESNFIAGLQTGPGGDRLLATDVSGGDGWSTTLSSSQLSIGDRLLYASAIDDRLARSQPVSATLHVDPANLPPQIVFVGATPTSVVQPAVLTLAAEGVTDADGLIARVDFYVESNNQAGLQTGVGGDMTVGADVSILNGWTTSFSTNGFADGKYRFYAQATDTLGGTSAAAHVDVQIGAPPPAGSVFLLEDLFSAAGGNGSSGFVVSGLNAGDQLGQAARLAADLNGDGFDELYLGVPGGDTTSPARTDAGKAYLVFGSPIGPGAEFDPALFSGSNGFEIVGLRSGDRAGSAIASVGDLNGDGFGDLVVGAAAADPATGIDAGEAYVVFGKAGGFGASLDLSALNGANGFRITGLLGGDATGVSVAGAGDVNGDGLADLLVGASNASPISPSRPLAGKSYLIFGSSGAYPAALNLASLNGVNGLALEGSTIQGRAGLAASPAGDLNGDGVADLVVGALDGPAGGGPNRGATYVVFGRSNAWTTPLQLDSLNGANGFRIDGLAAGDRFGLSIASLGDLNGDGREDLAIGAPGADPGATPRVDAGAVYVIYGAAAFSGVFDLTTIDGSNGTVVEGASAGDLLGFSVAAGDLNGDGFADLATGAPLASPGNPVRTEAGVVYVLFGRSTPFPAATVVTQLNGPNGFRLEGVAPGDHAGFAVGSAGDLNGDGYDDLAIGAPQADADAGQAYVFYGRDFTGSTSQAGDENINLLDGDPTPNVLVGGANHDQLIGRGGVDVLRGGQGDDLLAVSDLLFRQVDGGRGDDRLRIDGSGFVVNLGELQRRNQVAGIEEIDITGSGPNELIVDASSVLNASDDSNRLVVHRNSGDVVTIGAGWSLVDLQTIGTQSYYEFQQGLARLLIAAVPEGTPWQNPSNPLDVTNDGSVAPDDALVNINYLNENPNASDPLPNPPTPEFAPPPFGSQLFYDTNGDGYLSAIDALLVINFLNALAGGEGESADEPAADAPTDGPALDRLATLAPSIRQRASRPATATLGDPSAFRTTESVTRDFDEAVAVEFREGGEFGASHDDSPEPEASPDDWNSLLDLLVADQVAR